MSNEISAAEWLRAAETLAEKDRQPGETFEQAFARVTKSGPGRAFLSMHRHPAGRKPAPVPQASPITKRDAEARLHQLAQATAQATGQSYEQGFAAVLGTAEGVQLWQAVRG